MPKPNAGIRGVFETADAAETLLDNKAATRADWTMGKGTLSAYYFIDQYSLDNPYPTGTGGSSVPGFNATSSGRAQLFNLEHTITIGSTALNDVHLSYMRNANAVGQARGGLGTSLIDQGFTNIVPLKPSTEGVANVAFNDFTMGVDTTALVQSENIYEASDAFSRIVGKHGLKFGGEVHQSQINTHPDVVFNGSFGFNGSETGVDFADFLLGVTSSYTQGQAGSFYNRIVYMAAFAQDSWKLMTATQRSTTARVGTASSRGSRSTTSCRRWLKASSHGFFRARRWGWSFPAMLVCRVRWRRRRNNIFRRAWALHTARRLKIRRQLVCAAPRWVHRVRPAFAPVTACTTRPTRDSRRAL